MFRAVGGLLAAGAIVVYVILARRSIVTDVIGLLFGGGLLVLFLGELRRSMRRDVPFAVHRDGVYFGSEAIKDDVPWSQICAVELFTERVSHARGGSSYRCVGVRSPGTRQHSRAGNGPAAQVIPERAARYYLDAGRPDLVPGADGTIRYAYRRMTGWRVNPAQLAAAVARFAPNVPVVNGPAYPPPLTMADARAARQNRRGF